MTPLLHAIDMSKSYKDTRQEKDDVSVLKEVNLSVYPGDCISIMGPSGSGKSTLLHILGCMDRPTSGAFYFKGKNTQDLEDKSLSAIRAQEVGFVFQSFNLIPYLNVYENVILPFQYLEESERSIQEKALEALEQVKLSHRLKHLPKELSGGEIQRAAIARSLVKKPSLILADEPTGNLDSVNGHSVIALLKELNKNGVTLIVITHDKSIATQFNTHYKIHEGKIWQCS